MLFFDSPSYGEWCKRVFGRDLKQLGNVTIDELELLFRELQLKPKSSVLDMGCGAGYISAFVSEQLEAHVTGIDIADVLISHANDTFRDNTSLSFQCLDFNEISFNRDSFDLVCFFDTLCFADSIDNLRGLLDKCLLVLKSGGKLAVFWTNHPSKYDIYKMSKPDAAYTQVGIWGADNNIQTKAIELTEGYRQFWQKASAGFQLLKNELTSEIPDFYEARMKECDYFADICSKGDAGGVFRWLYIFTKN